MYTSYGDSGVQFNLITITIDDRVWPMYDVIVPEYCPWSPIVQPHPSCIDMAQCTQPKVLVNSSRSRFHGITTDLFQLQRELLVTQRQPFTKSKHFCALSLEKIGSSGTMSANGDNRNPLFKR